MFDVNDFNGLKEGENNGTKIAQSIFFLKFCFNNKRKGE